MTEIFSHYILNASQHIPCSSATLVSKVFEQSTLLRRHLLRTFLRRNVLQTCVTRKTFYGTRTSSCPSSFLVVTCAEEVHLCPNL